MAVDTAELVRRAQRFGLEEGEAHVYLHLCRIGAARAAEVARAAGRRRTDTYRLLDTLVEKGFAQKSLERPARYLPEPPEAALRAAMEAQRRSLASLETEKDTLAALWPRSVTEAQPSRDRFAVLQGRSQISGLVLRLVREAHEEVLLATSSDGLGRLDAPSLFAALQERAAAGVSVRVLARRSDAAARAIPPMAGVRQRWGAFTTFYHALIVDERDTVLFVAGGKGISGDEETVIWLSSSDIVLSQKALFDLAWNQAHATPGTREEDPAHLRVIRGRWVRDTRLKALVQGAKGSVLLSADAAEAGRWERTGLARALAERAAEGVSVVLCVPPGSIVVPGARQVAPAEPPGPLLAIVDGLHSLVALPTAPGEANEDDWAMVSNHAALAGLLAGRLVPTETAGNGGPWARHEGGNDAATVALRVRPGGTDQA